MEHADFNFYKYFGKFLNPQEIVMSEILKEWEEEVGSFLVLDECCRKISDVVCSIKSMYLFRNVNWA